MDDRYVGCDDVYHGIMTTARKELQTREIMALLLRRSTKKRLPVLGLSISPRALVAFGMQLYDYVIKSIGIRVHVVWVQAWYAHCYCKHNL